MEVKIQAQPIAEKDTEKKEYGKYDRWDIESATRTLVEAEEIKADKEKMKYVAMCMKKKYLAEKKVIESIEDLKQARQNLDQTTEEE
ncbi:MAG TPA: hypothetical protein VFF49_04875 [Thermodesulfobacteriota bacterium]|nr:hypothetical protein [Thermodesulfobacteriota bacterium]